MGRIQTPRVRVGHREQRRIQKLLEATKNFVVTSADATTRETTLNKRLLKILKAKDSDVTSLKTIMVRFAGESFVPDGVLKGKAAYPLLAIECKRLTEPKAAKRCWKEGLAQAALYSRRYKVVFLVLYDFTPGSIYKKAFGKGNKCESSFARQLKDMRLHVIALAP